MLTRRIKELTAFLDQVQKTPSINDKMVMLRAYKDQKLLKRVIWYTYFPHRTYGVQLKTALKERTFGKSTNLFEYLNKFAHREITGTEAAVKAKQLYNQYGPLVGLILKKDLGIGVSVKSINKTWQRLIPEFKVALGVPLHSVKKEINFKKYLASRKMDGVRGVLIKDGRGVHIYSRTGRIYESLTHLENAASLSETESFVLDGELCLIENGIERFKECSGLVKRKNYQAADIRYCVFDVLTLKEFYGRQKSPRLKKRLLRYNSLGLNPDLFMLLDQKEMNSEEDLIALKNEAQEKGWEGLILRKNTNYKNKRSQDIIKVKRFKVEVGTIIDTHISKMFISSLNEEVDCIGSVTVKITGGSTKMGSGFSQEQRLYYKDHLHELLDRKVKVSYFEESFNKKGERSLRFPIFEGFIDD